MAYTITLSRQGGTGSPNPIYWDDGSFYLDEEQTNPITQITPPTREGYAFNGFFTKTTGGTKYINSNGRFNATFLALVLTGDLKIYAQWTRTSYKITIDKDGGTGGTDSLYYRIDGGGYFSDEGLTTEITEIVKPTKPGNIFDGAWESKNKGGIKYIGTAGNLASALRSKVWSSDGTIYVGYNRTSYEITLSRQSGTGGTSRLYYRISGGGIYTDVNCTTAATKITVPTREGYTYNGHWSATGGSGTKYINTNGNLASSLTGATFSADSTIYAAWTPKTYTATFDYQGGTVSTRSKTVTFNAAIGTLPTTTKPNAVFDGWYLNGVKITSASVWNIPRNEYVVARWIKNFGNVTDYFDLASDSLIPLSSTNGDNKQRICVSHNGKYETGVSQISGIWRNPTVTYTVAKSMTLAVTLGRAFAATGSISGYMIVSVTVNTLVGQFPTVIVEAVANEGKNAINQFPVSIPIVARSKAQNLLNSVSGGGRLNSCTVRASCDPVVVSENMMPCASDVVHGRIEVAANTIATNRENPPAASNGFTSVGEPKQEDNLYYTTYSINAQKEI